MHPLFRPRLGCLLMPLALLVGCEAPLNEEPWVPPRMDRAAEEVAPGPEADYGRPLAAGQLALRKIPPEQYPDFSPGFADLAGLERAIRYSQEYLRKPSSQRYFPYGEITHRQAVDSLEAFLSLIRSGRSPQELDAALRQDFEVYQSIGWDDRGTVLFTGYYTPIFDGRMQREEGFDYPLHAMPPDLVKTAEGVTRGRKTADGSIVPYYTRREIVEQNKMRGLEIVWLRDPFEAYIATIQGSVKVRLGGGDLYELGYAANNGYDYKSVGQQLVADGVLSRNELSLQRLRRFFAENPEKVNEYCNQNDRYVFFQPERGGPFGSINVPVTPYRTLATDKEVFPRACMAFFETTMPSSRSPTPAAYAGFALDQDTGGAIRAAGRSDVYFGVGPEAEALAGATLSEGRLYYVFLRAGGQARADTDPADAVDAGRVSLGEAKESPVTVPW